MKFFFKLTFIFLILPVITRAQTFQKKWTISANAGREKSQYKWVNSYFLNYYGVPPKGNTPLGRGQFDDIRIERRLSRYLSIGLQAEDLFPSTGNDAPCLIKYKNTLSQGLLSGYLSSEFLGGILLARLTLNPFLCPDSSYFSQHFRLSIIGGAGAGGIRLDRSYVSFLPEDSFQIITNAQNSEYMGVAYPFTGACNLDFLMSSGQKADLWGSLEAGYTGLIYERIHGVGNPYWPGMKIDPSGEYCTAGLKLEF